MKRRILSLALAFAMLILPLMSAACGNTDNNDAGNNILGDEEKILSPAFGGDHLTFDYADFLVMTRNDLGAGISWNTMDVVAENNFGDSVIVEAVHKRNERIKENFKVNIKRSAVSDIVNEANMAIQKQDYSYDTFLMRIRDALNLALSGAAMDYSDQEYIDLSSDWWDQGVIENLTLLGGQYIALGDINITDDESTWCTLFNKTILEAYGYTDQQLYNKVYEGDGKEGGFTTEYLTIVSKIAYKQDPNVKDKWSNTYAGSGTYGLFIEKEVATALMISSGNTPTKIDSGMAGVAPNIYAPEFQDALDEVFGFMGNRSTEDWYCLLNDINDGTSLKFSNTIRPAFMANKAAFYITPFDTIGHLRDMKSDFGVLPMPKISATQLEYGTTIQYNTTAYVTPYRIDDDLNDKSAYVLEAMGYYSSPEFCGEECLKYAYYTLALQAKGTRDDASWEMIDFILKNRVFDLSCMLDVCGINSIINTAANGSYNNWVSERDAKLGNMSSVLAEKLEILAKGK